MAGQRSRDQEADGAVGARHVVLAAAMDGAGGEHQLVAHQHDAALDVGGMLGEFVRRAAAEIDHLGGEPVLSAWRCVRTSGWQAAIVPPGRRKVAVLARQPS